MLVCQSSAVRGGNTQTRYKCVRTGTAKGWNGFNFTSVCSGSALQRRTRKRSDRGRGECVQEGEEQFEGGVCAGEGRAEGGTLGSNNEDMMRTASGCLVTSPSLTPTPLLNQNIINLDPTLWFELNPFKFCFRRGAARVIKTLCFIAPEITPINNTELAVHLICMFPNPKMNPKFKL